MITLALSWLASVARAENPSLTGISPNSPISTTANSGLSDLANRIVDTLSFLAYPLAFVAIIYTAYVLITSGSSPDGWTKAKKNVNYILIGFFLIFGAAIFVKLLRSIILT